MSKRYFWLTPAARKRFLCRMAARCLGPGLTNELWDKIDSLENPGSQTEHNSGASTIWWFRMDGRRNWSERSNGFHPTVIDIRWQGLMMMTGGPNGEVDNESLDIDKEKLGRRWIGQTQGGRKVGESGKSEPCHLEASVEVIHCRPGHTASYLFQLYPTQASQCGGSWQCNLLVCKLLPMRGVRPPAGATIHWNTLPLVHGYESLRFNSVIYSANSNHPLVLLGPFHVHCGRNIWGAMTMTIILMRVGWMNIIYCMYSESQGGDVRTGK